MTLLEVIKSGRAFKRPNDKQWWIVNQGWILDLEFKESILPPTVDNLTATDWEVEGPTVNLTYEEFYAHFMDAQNYGIKNTWEVILKQKGITE